MSRSRWHIRDADGVLTLSRRLPARFDVAAQTHLPAAPAARVAHQVRQDLWRRLQDVRGFQPVVEVTRRAGGLSVRAGGSVAARAFPRARIEAEIAALLADDAHRARWIAHATRRGAADA